MIKNGDCGGGGGSGASARARGPLLEGLARRL